jgi:FkbM family methyltransferase
MTRLLKYSLSLLALAAVSLGSAYMGLKVGRRFERNVLCCQVPRERNLRLSIRETLGLAAFPSQIGQDKWVTETVFPDLTHGFFLDVGSGDGTVDSNSKVLEQKGWTGICIDPFPTNMHDRTCRMLKEVVFSEAGRKMSFQASGLLGGISDTLGAWKDTAMKAATVEFTTTTLAAILKTEEAPRFIHFISLDIEGAELEALKGFPFDQYRIGAMAVEHNFEEPKRTQIRALMKQHGYRRVHSWSQDDFYRPADSTRN